jgi:hypothetical protein
MQLRVFWKPTGRVPMRSLADYISPLQPVPKTAVLTPGFRESKRVRVFPFGWSEEAVRFRPAVLAGPTAEIVALGRNWRGEWPSPTHAVVVFSREGIPLLDDAARDLLWNLFGLPVFEQYLDDQCELLAAECDAHDGLHVLSDRVSREDCVRVEGPCGCGSSAPRLRSVRARGTAAGA